MITLTHLPQLQLISYAPDLFQTINWIIPKYGWRTRLARSLSPLSSKLSLVGPGQ